MSPVSKQYQVPRKFSRFLLAFSTCSTLMYGTNFVAVGSLQSWTVPQTGTYQIIAVGGSGGTEPYTFLPNSDGGHGANVTGDYLLSGGDVLSILVGQAGGNGTSSFDKYGAGGGGGASVVQDASGFTYVIAGGGGGGGASSDYNGNNAGATSSAGVDGDSSHGGGAAGTNEGGGGGGQVSAGGGGGGGAGLTSSGGSGTGDNAGSGGMIFSGNANGGSDAGSGGFGGGGGGGGNINGGGGGGGGYNGGGGGIDGGGGGGGGSFSVDPQATFSTASFPGDGYIYINPEVGAVTPVPEPAEVGLLILAIALVLPARVLRRKLNRVAC